MRAPFMGTTSSGEKVVKVGIVTVTYNSGQVIDDFLDCILAQSHADFRLLIIDNASKDDSIAKARARLDPRIEIIPNGDNLGVATGNNQGIRRALVAGCDAVLLINNDTVFPPDLVATLIQELDASGADMTTPKITYYDPPDRIWCAGGRLVPYLAQAPRHIGLGELDDGRFDRPAWITYAPTCCLLVVARVFDTVGLMDDAYFVYWDDADFMYRAFRKKLRLRYVPAVTLRHKVSSLTGGGQTPFTVRYETRNQIYFIRKHFPATAPAWIALHFARFAARYLIGRDTWSSLGIRVKAFREGLTMPLRPVPHD
jgi:GT2 family glycosyltransferase